MSKIMEIYFEDLNKRTQESYIELIDAKTPDDIDMNNPVSVIEIEKDKNVKTMGIYFEDINELVQDDYLSFIDAQSPDNIHLDVPIAVIKVKKNNISRIINVSFDDLNNKGYDMLFDHLKIDTLDLDTTKPYIGYLEINDDIFNVEPSEEMTLSLGVYMTVYYDYLSDKGKKSYLNHVNIHEHFSYDIFNDISIGVLKINKDLINKKK